MPDARYVLADVFTSVAFGGNQLAVFPDAADLTPEQMQVLARELNLAESTFVTDGSAPGRWRVRIFTPVHEIPFAGHPTVGTAVVLLSLGRVAPGTEEIVLEENVGPVRVVLGPESATLFMDGPPEIRALATPVATVAAALGLAEDDLAGRPWQASYGVPFVFVPVKDQEAVARSALHLDRWRALLGSAPWARSVHVHAVTETAAGAAAVHARMYAPDAGIAEDPATGSAAAALAGSIAGLAPVGGRLGLRIIQGVEMGRPSLILAEAIHGEAGVSGVSVGGRVVVVGEGRFSRLP